MPGSVSSPRGSRTSGDVPANVSRRSASLTSRSSSVHGPHLSCSGRYRNGSSESSAARRRLRRTRCSLKRSYTAHACRFSPYRPPSAAMLDPFPNASINSLCVVGLSTLLTVHRTGVRLYRQRQLPAPAPPSTLNMLASRPSSNAAVPSASPAAVPHGVCEATGVFELIETRHEFQVRESYLCAAMQPVVVNGSLFLSKWSRYFCVASGSDRIVHGVSVMSSGAHFCLNHTQHQTSKVVCMQCTQLALEPCHPLSLTPAVVSVDEVGVVVLFDIEREVASVLEQAPLWYRQTDARPREKGAAADPSHVTNSTRDSGGHAGSGLHQAPLQQQHLTPEEEDHVLNTIEKAAMSERVVYHLEHGVATRVALVGPCVELCNRCHNAFSRSMSSSRGYKLVSLYLCSRARDVPADATPPEHLGDGEGGGAAELNVVLLRVLWGPRRAFVLEEVHLLHEVAPTDVCDVGIAMNSPPYEVGMPMTLLLARPALELWKLRGCTGDLIETCRVYAANSDGPRCGSCRDASECFLQWVPLGRHRLIVEKATESEEENSWSCTVAMTNNDTVLLLGSAPMPVNRDALGKTALVAASLVGDQGISTTRKELAAEPFKDTDLEAWLDDISVPASRSSSLPAAESSLTAPAAANCTGPPAAESTATDDDGDNDGVSAACHAVTFPYTVLMELYAPQRSYSSRTRESASAVSTVLLSVMPDWTANRLLLFMEDQETLLSVPLPFLERVGTLTDAKQHEADGREGTGVAAGPSIPTSGVDDLLPSTSTAQNPHVVSQETQPGRMIQYFKSASTHLWGPSAPSHFFHLDASGGEVTRAPPVLSAPPTEAHTSPADDRSAAQFSDAAAVSSSATAAAGSREPYRFFSLTRPLMAAFFHLSGEHEEPASLAVVEAPLKDPVTSVTGDAKAPGIALSMPPIQQAGNGVIGSPPACPSPLTVSADGERSGTQHRCRRGSSSESSRAGSSRYRRTRKPQRIGNGAPASSAEAAHTVIIEEGAAARASYVSAQIALLKEEPKAQRGSRTSETGVIADEDHGAQHEAATTVSQWQYALRRVAEVEEPLERNALLYAWKDGHNDLYIHFSVELDELRQREAADEEDGHAVPLSRRGETGSISPDASRHSRGTARPRLTLCRPADVEDGIHSMGFLSQYNAVVHRRAATASYGNCFDFSSYFVTLQVPQHVLDVQERDKYRLELEDLRLQQARDLASLHPYDMVTIFQNEERVSAKDAAWRLHATFPYDDAQDGHAVDLQQLNRTAVRDPAAAAASEWRWADASEARAWSKEHDLARSSTNRVRSLVKDLKDWEVGPWAYATRWPSREEELRGDDGFIWSASEAPEHTCRRRRLSRLRVSIAELKRQTELMASHQRELEELREALGL